MDEWIGSVTTAWARARLDRVATINARIGWKALTAAEYQAAGYAFLSTPNIKSERIDFDDVNFVSEFRYEESPELKLRRGDVLLAKDGSTLGITNVVRDLPRPATVNGSIAVIRPFAIESRYLMYVLRGSRIQEWIGQVKDGMGVPHLFQADIKKFNLPLPSEDEQRRIADFLDDQVASIDNIMALRRVQVVRVIEHSQSALQRMFDEGASGTRPLATLTDPRRPIQYGIVLPGPDFPGGVPIVKGGDIASGRLRRGELNRTDPEIEQRYSRSRLIDGDLVIAIRGSVGEVDVVPDGLRDINLTQDAARIAPFSVDATWLRWVLTIPSVQADIRRRVTGAMVTGINIEALRQVRIPDTPHARQLEIGRAAGEVAQSTQATTELLRSSIAAFESLKGSLITAAVTGEFDVSSADGSRVAV